MTKVFDYEIVKRIGTLTDDPDSTVTLELNLLSWNGSKPGYDLRKWKTEKDGTRKPLKGIVITKPELDSLKQLIEGLED
jgi:hypothetical protein